MNDWRRAAFAAMARHGKRHSGQPWRSYFERDVMSRDMALSLQSLGWLKRNTGRPGRLTGITLTDFGMWVLGGAP